MNTGYSGPVYNSRKAFNIGSVFEPSDDATSKVAVALMGSGVRTCPAPKSTNLAGRESHGWEVTPCQRAQVNDGLFRAPF